jgi:hypothetical protein
MDAARDLRCRKTEISEALHHGGYIEGGMDRITGACVIQRKFE